MAILVHNHARVTMIANELRVVLALVIVTLAQCSQSFAREDAGERIEFC